MHVEEVGGLPLRLLRGDDARHGGVEHVRDGSVSPVVLRVASRRVAPHERCHYDFGGRLALVDAVEETHKTVCRLVAERVITVARVVRAEVQQDHVRIVDLRKEALNVVVDAIGGILQLPSAVALVVAVGEEGILLAVVVRLRAHVIDIVAEVRERHVERRAVAVAAHGLRSVSDRVAERHDAQDWVIGGCSEHGAGDECKKRDECHDGAMELLSHVFPPYCFNLLMIL